VFCVATIVFFLMHLVPGDVVDVMFGGGETGGATAEQMEVVRKALGLDQPLLVQYLRWLARIMRGDLGRSPLSGRLIAPDVLRQLPRTLELALASMCIALLLGIPLGIFAALKANRPLDFVIGTFSLIGLSTPNFVVGTFAILAFGLYLQWLPLAGFVSFTENPWEHLRLLLFPSAALGLSQAAFIIRMTRSAMLEVLRQDYIRTAQAKGVRDVIVHYKHALRNALIPVVTLTGIQMGTLLGGTVVIEYVFSWPGLSTLLINGVWRRDYPMVQAVVLIIAGGFILINLLVDIINAYIDPRIRYD
ncbi:MAG: ABC transporter permease, partial [Nitrospinota bacterium]